MILTKPVIFQEGVDRATNQPVISITAPDAPDPINGQPCGASLVFADVQALRHFARRLLATAYAIAHGHFVNKLVPGEHKPALVSRYTEPCPKDPEECGIITVKDFIASVKNGFLIDYDGYGNPMKEGRIDPRCYVSPSKLNNIPEDATHIAWYNR